MAGNIEVEIDRRNWVANNLIQLVTVLVIAISAVAVARYKLTVYDKFAEDQTQINQQVFKQINDLAYTVDLQNSLQKQNNEQVARILGYLEDSNRQTQRLLAVLEDRSKTGYTK